MEVKIIYEDKFLLALHKPAGLMVHSDGRSDEPTLVDWIRGNYPELENVGEEEKLQNGEIIKRPGIVHRLDKETSGVIIVAKSPESFLFLKEQFKKRNVEKIYRAFVWGNFKEREGSINTPIGRSRGGFQKMVC